MAERGTMGNLGSFWDPCADGCTGLEERRYRNVTSGEEITVNVCPMEWDCSFISGADDVPDKKNWEEIK